ncbi:MAG TPA: DUF2252 domain-containing protein [Polyangiaceae bacterium]|nr:DUF2252 domain-containing protein [Polyangiaceae bacterium]
MRKTTDKPAKHVPRLLSPAERRDRGRALREKVPREKHAEWKAPKDRRPPLDLLRENDEGRLPELLPIRYGRMAQSAFGFFRGSPAVMAADLARTPSSGILVQACGDAHVTNFGGFATPERNIIFDLNDFDETLQAPWEWDLKRLVASVVVASRQNGFSERDGVRAARGAVTAYRERMAEYARMKVLDVWYDRITLDDVLRAAPVKTQKRILQRVEAEQSRSAPEYLFPKLVMQQGATPRIKDSPPLIYHIAETQRRAEYSGALAKTLADYRASLGEHLRVLFDRYAYRDLAIKVVGVGSVGTMCMIALFTASDDDPLFLQVKEARASVLEPYVGKSPYENHGQRVVEGLRLMQAASDIFIGYTHGRVVGRDFYIRQLRDMKMGALVETMDEETLRIHARLCARALARAHARSGDPATLSGYMGSSRVFDEALADFAVAYADQAERDHRKLLDAIRDGKIRTINEA